MMHPTRAKYKKYLLKRLGDVPVVLDRGAGVWDTARRAWLKFDKTKDFHLVIQDDAIICNKFLERLEPILKDKNMAYNLYYGNRGGKTREIAKKGLEQGYVISEWLCWAVGIILPTHFIKEMIEYCDKVKMQNDDTKIAKFLTSKKIKTYYPMPSLLDHRATMSLVEKRHAGKRKAYCFIDNGIKQRIDSSISLDECELAQKK